MKIRGMRHAVSATPFLVANHTVSGAEKRVVKKKSIVAIERAIRSSLEASIANAACIHASRECAAPENKRILMLFNFCKICAAHVVKKNVWSRSSSALLASSLLWNDYNVFRWGDAICATPVAMAQATMLMSLIFLLRWFVRSENFFAFGRFKLVLRKRVREVLPNSRHPLWLWRSH